VNPVSHAEPSGSAVEGLLAEGRPRADAERNVRRLVEAAREAVAEVGVDVTAHEIARRAGVGIGTFYRRVPSRDALLVAVLSDTIAEIVELAGKALRDVDPWRGFREFATAFIALRAASRGINEALGGGSALDLDGPLAELRLRMRRIVERAQDAGAMRVDIAWPDVPFLLAAAMPGEHTIGLRADEDQWRRNLRVVLDGLHTPATGAAPRSTQPGEPQPGAARPLA
jgi:AcrR family transcriptional regulator